jgi:hypothetical protein
MHAQARMKIDAAARFVTPLLGWLIEECRRFRERTGRTDLSPADQKALMEAFEQLATARLKWSAPVGRESS